MIRRVIEAVRSVVPTREDSSTPSEHAPDGGVSTALFRCPTCEATYIGEEMATCPSCGGDLVQTPTEHDLGFRTSDDSE